MNQNIIGKKLLLLRGKKSREQVAKRVKVSVSALQMYENGKRVPRDEIKIRIAEYYGTTVQDIFFGEQPHESCGKSYLA